jgi:hypothetical protein
MPRDLYRVLQVDPSADAEVLEAAYWRLARKYHPDVSSAADAEARMRELNDAYATLRDPARRAVYDRARADARRRDARSTTAERRPEAPAAAARPGHRRAPARPAARPTDRRAAPSGRPILVRVRARWEALADGLLAHRYLLLGAASALLLTALLAAFAATLFVPTEPPAPAAEGTRPVVLITRVPTAEPTPTERPAARGQTPTGWPPFIYVPVPVQAPTPTVEEVPTAMP